MHVRASPAFRRLTIATIGVTYLLIVWGGVVRVSGSGAGCGVTDQWPLCQGRLLPPWQEQAVIEFTHRWLAAMATLLVVSVAVASVRRWLSARERAESGVDVGYRRGTAQISAVVVALFVVQIVLGAITVMNDLPGSVIAIHLANAELLLGALILLAVRARFEGTDRMHRCGPSPALASVYRAAAATYVLVVSGSLVVANGAGGACAGWPLCGNGLQLGGDQLAAINLIHRLVAAVVVVLIGIAVMRIRRAHPGRIGLRVAGIMATALLVAQVIAGAVMVEEQLPPVVRGIHEALASALWATMALMALLARTASYADASTIADAAAITAENRRPAVAVS